MKTDAAKYLMRITQAQKYSKYIVENNSAAKWEDMTGKEAIPLIIQWAEQQGYNPTNELYFQGRQAGRVAMAREIIGILGRPLEPDEGGLDVEIGHLYDALTRIVDEMEYEAGNGHVALRIAKETLEKKQNA